MKQNSAIGASTPVVDPVVQPTRWIAIRRGWLRSLLLDTVQVDLYPGMKLVCKHLENALTHKRGQNGLLQITYKMRINTEHACLIDIVGSKDQN